MDGIPLETSAEGSQPGSQQRANGSEPTAGSATVVFAITATTTATGYIKKFLVFFLRTIQGLDVLRRQPVSRACLPACLSAVGCGVIWRRT